MGYTVKLEVHEVLKGNANVWLQNYMHNFQEQQYKEKIVIIIIIIIHLRTKIEHPTNFDKQKNYEINNKNLQIKQHK